MYKFIGPCRQQKNKRCWANRPLSSSFGKLWQSSKVAQWLDKRQVSHPTFKVKEQKVGNYTLTSDHREILEQVLFQAISGHMKNMKMTVNIQCGFSKDDSCLTNLIAFYNGMTDSVDEERTLDSFILTLSRLLTESSVIFI